MDLVILFVFELGRLEETRNPKPSCTPVCKDTFQDSRKVYTSRPPFPPSSPVHDFTPSPTSLPEDRMVSVLPQVQCVLFTWPFEALKGGCKGRGFPARLLRPGGDGFICASCTLLGSPPVDRPSGSPGPFIGFAEMCARFTQQLPLACEAD